MYGQGPAGIPPPLPPPEPVAPGMGNPRYVYLLTRLRNRQITMEEATELFAMQQQLLASALATRAPPPPPVPPGAPPPSAPAPSRMPMVFDDESLALSLLAFGAGAGMLAAVLKRAQEGPRRPAP